MSNIFILLLCPGAGMGRVLDWPYWPAGRVLGAEGARGDQDVSPQGGRPAPHQRRQRRLYCPAGGGHLRCYCLQHQGGGEAGRVGQQEGLPLPLCAQEVPALREEAER